jgi:hypothetical protein
LRTDLQLLHRSIPALQNAQQLKKHPAMPAHNWLCANLRLRLGEPLPERLVRR